MTDVALETHTPTTGPVHNLIHPLLLELGPQMSTPLIQIQDGPEYMFHLVGF